ncbi:MAG: GNAT family N-acetyltransferase [Bdellovibrionales bacterium]|nr:GNAT family N-acetyltransferase [Bdellovibrionales bacterium]
MQFRKARPGEHDTIYLMGYDTWGVGQSIETHLRECRESEKYKMGIWYVISDADDVLYSSLIHYDLGSDSCGIGSIATAPDFRKKGHASSLIQAALERFNHDGFSKVFLFSDIDPRFYEKFGFRALSSSHQAHKKAVCMVWGTDPQDLENQPGFKLPDYF